MRFWISRGTGESEDFIFYESSKPKDDFRQHRSACYSEFRSLTKIRLRPGESIEVKLGRKFMWAGK